MPAIVRTAPEPAPNCSTAASVLMLPGRKREMRLHAGYGSADLSATFENGMVASIGQKTDTKVPETLGAVADLATSVARFTTPAVAKETCKPAAALYPIVDGQVQTTTPVRLPAPQG